LANYIKQQVT